MKIQTVHLLSMRNFVSAIGTARIKLQEPSSNLNRNCGRSNRNYSAAPPSPTVTVNNVNNVGLNTRTRNIGTHVSPSLLVKEQLTLNESVYGLVSKEVLHEVSLKSLLDDNPDIKRFICKVAVESSGSFDDHENQNQSSDSVKKQDDGESGKHPFIRVAGDLFFQEDEFPSSLSTPGILVYLMGKLFQGDPYDDYSELANIIKLRKINEKYVPKMGLGRETCLHELFLMVGYPTWKIRHLSKSVNHSCAAFRIHRTIQDTSRNHVWNKLATLAGDLLVVECIKNVASIGDNEVLLWTMDSLAEFSSSEFQTQKGHSRQVILRPEGSILSTGFRGVAKLAGCRDPLLQRQLDHLGMTLGYLWMDGEDENGQDRRVSEHNNNHTSVSVNAMMKESLDILLTQQFHGYGSDTDITGFFKDFILYYAPSQSQLQNQPQLGQNTSTTLKSIHVI